MTAIATHIAAPTFEIESSTTPGTYYTVSVTGCTCPSFTYRQAPCKHMADPRVFNAFLISLGWGSRTVTPQAQVTPARQARISVAHAPAPHRCGGPMAAIDCIDCD